MLAIGKNLLLLMRPHQWIKNVFVFVHLAFGHAWHDPVIVRAALTTFTAFCLVSSGVYVFNDIFDRNDDRKHSLKRTRPIASGHISVTCGAVFGMILLAAGAGLGLWTSHTVFSLLAIYVALNFAYSLKLKHVVIVDVFVIAAGFMLRILAGTLGIGFPPSQWLMLCGMMITLFLGFAKRRAELAQAVTNNDARGRRVLDAYGLTLLDNMLAVTAAGAIISFSLYTMSPETILLHGTSNLIYTVPFVVYGIFRYMYLTHIRGAGDDTAKDLLDPHLIAAVVCWLAAMLWLTS